MSCLSKYARPNKKCNQKHRRQFKSFQWPPRKPAHEIMALFSSSQHFTPKSSDIVILVRTETTKSFAISQFP